MKYGSILKPFTIWRPEYFEGLAKEAVADRIQLEINLDWLAEHGGKNSEKC